MKILYVEDDLSVAQVAKFLFLKTNHQIVFCQTVADATNIVTTCGKKIDLIFLDLRLPDASGVTLLKHLRNIGLNMPVIVASGFYADHEEDVQPFEESGQIRMVLHKPFSMDDLLSTLQSLENSLTK